VSAPSNCCLMPNVCAHLQGQTIERAKRADPRALAKCSALLCRPATQVGYSPDHAFVDGVDCVRHNACLHKTGLVVSIA
jgi:hypothetical protein